MPSPGAALHRLRDTCHHLLPSSQYPEAFWDPGNLQASCRACNYAGGAYTKAENRRWRIAQLEQVIDAQQANIDQLLARLVTYEDGPATEPARTGRVPRIS
jgi:5-methylcytosine-specific restriction endonuclease McrA